MDDVKRRGQKVELTGNDFKYNNEKLKLTFFPKKPITGNIKKIPMLSNILLTDNIVALSDVFTCLFT